MDLFGAIESRHAVRAYRETPVERELLDRIRKEVSSVNSETSLHFQVVENEERAFSGFLAHYGKFDGVRNYIALVGEKRPGLDEAVGYYGERLVLFMQTLGINTCWVGMTFSKMPGASTVNPKEKLVATIAFGYGRTSGVSHKLKDFSKVSLTAESDAPEWYRAGIRAALLAPSALNRQKFRFSLNGDGTVSAKPGFGFYTKVDLGIAKLHFEIGSGRDSSVWKKD